MKKINLLLILNLLFLGLFISCEKEATEPEEQQDTSICDETALEKNYFTYDYMSKSNPNLIGSSRYTEEQQSDLEAKMKAVRLDNCESRFVNDVSAVYGLPVWDRASVRWKSDGTPIIFTAFVKLTEDRINAVLIGEKKEDFVFTLFDRAKIEEELKENETPELRSQLDLIEGMNLELFGKK